VHIDAQVRHGESEADLRNVIQSNPAKKYDIFWSLTDEGREQTRQAVRFIQDDLDIAPNW
jgi:broad specificity phosphatase PhoE